MPDRRLGRPFGPTTVMISASVKWLPKGTPHSQPHLDTHDISESIPPPTRLILLKLIGIELFILLDLHHVAEAQTDNLQG